MSGRRISMMVMPEDCLTFDIIAEAGQTFSYKTYSKGAVVDFGIGNGIQTMEGDEKIEITYPATGLYKFRIYSCQGTYGAWRGTANIVRSNERWEFINSFATLYRAFAEMPNSECRFRTLPSETNWDQVFLNSTKATVPITEIPDVVRSLAGTFQAVKSFAGNIVNFPDSVTRLDNTFDATAGTGKVVVTKLPPNVTTLRAFSNKSSLVHADLDELAANAPEGGYQKLTTLYYAFNGNPNIIGSRSAFLSVCPNVTDTTNAFNGTNTTE